MMGIDNSGGRIREGRGIVSGVFFDNFVGRSVKEMKLRGWSWPWENLGQGKHVCEQVGISRFIVTLPSAHH